MNDTVRRGIGGLLAILLTLGLVALSRVKVEGVPANSAEVRLAWRFRSDRIQQCRKFTPEELAKIPAHMRLKEDCQRRLRPYRLEVALDSDAAGVDTIHAGGAEEDRPLYVFRRLATSGGRHRVRVSFAPLGTGGPAPLVLDTVFDVGPRGVALVTLESDRPAFLVRAAPAGRTPTAPPGS